MQLFILKSSLLPYFNYKHIVLLSIHHFCGSKELREDAIMLRALCPPRKCLSLPPDVIFIVGISHEGFSIIWLPISILTTITSVHDTLGYIFPMLGNSHPTYPAITCHSEIWNKPKTGCEYRMHFVENPQIIIVSLWKWKTPYWDKSVLGEEANVFILWQIHIYWDCVIMDIH